MASKHELRCPECRILVRMQVDDLPPNVLLMRILGGLKLDISSKEIADVSSTAATPQPKKELTRDPEPPKSNLEPSALKPTVTPIPPPQQILPRPVLGGAPLPHKYLPQNVCHAKALFDFQSNINGDLAFKKGDVIVLRRRIDQNWFYGHLNGREGAFPVNHVQIIVPLPVPQCRAVFDFRMGPNEEEGCLSFAKGQIITVIRRVDQNWAEGRIGECIGIFPINFVEMNSLAKQLMGGDKDIGRSSIGEASLSNTPSATAGPADTNAATANQRMPPMPIKTEVPVVRRVPSLASQVNAARRHSADLLNPTTGGALNSTAHLESVRMSIGDIPRVHSCVLAVFPYKPQKPDELELIKGGE